MAQDRAINRLKGSDLGYFGKGVPGPETISELEKSYFQKLMTDGYVAPEVLVKYELMLVLHQKAFEGEKPDEHAMMEASKLANELAPIMHFKVDDVDWDK